MKKILSITLVCVMLLALGALAVSAEEPIFVFDIKGVNIQITGEDAVLCTTQDGYTASGSVWAIAVPCKIISDNVLQVTHEALKGNGERPDITVSEGVVVLVVHSSTSDTAQAEKYPNVFAKNAAMAVKTGQYLILDGFDLAAGTGAGTATLVDKLPDDISVAEPVESSEEPVESSEEPAESSEEPAESSEEPAAASSEEPAAASSEAPAAESEAPAESTEESKEEDGGLSAGTIALIVAAAVVVIAAIAFFVLKGKKK